MVVNKRGRCAGIFVCCVHKLCLCITSLHYFLHSSLHVHLNTDINRGCQVTTSTQEHYHSQCPRNTSPDSLCSSDPNNTKAEAEPVSQECPACFEDSLELVRATCKCGVRFCEPCTLMQVSECVRKGEVPMCVNSSECGQKMRRSEVMRLQVLSVG